MIFPSAQNRGVVVFLIWNGLAFHIRVALGAGLLLAGLAFQAVTLHFLPGLPFLLGSILFFLVRGFDNRVDFGRFDPAVQWDQVAFDKLDQLIEHDRRMARWDRSALDVTNGLGAFVLVSFAATLVFLAFASQGALQILIIDALVLLVPHWLTGTRSVIRQPNLVLKADLLRRLVQRADSALSQHTPQLLMLLQGEQRIPTDLKLKVSIKDQAPEFLGLYGQLVLNRVQGKPYPYFYAVLVTKPGCGLRELGQSYRAPDKLISELKEQSDVEVFVIRQRTTKTSGYHTKPATMELILSEGLRLAERWSTASLPGQADQAGH